MDPHANRTAHSSLVLDAILASEYPTLTEMVTIKLGEGELTAGAVLGKVTADGEYRLSDTASADGSEAPSRILAMDIDATAAAGEAVVYKVAHVRGADLTLGGAHTLDSIKADLHALSIFID